MTTEHLHRKEVMKRCAGIACWMLLALALIAGCGPSLVRVQGRVTLDGTALDNGVISFRPSGNTAGPAGGAEIKDGHYQLATGLIPGTYAVEIRAWRTTGKRVQGPAGETDERVSIIPDRYFGESTSLQAEVTPDGKAVDFDLAK